MAETWTPIDDPTAFQDDAVFEIDKKTKSIQVLIEQPIVAGENKSQFIKFQMGRYYDAIDLTQMEVNILYESPTGYQDINAAVNREYSDEYIRFGWLVPYAACPVKGTLGFAVEFVGADYVLKTTRGETPVLDSISGSSSVPEPTEQTWYIELQSQVAAAIDNANSTLESVREYIDTFQGNIDDAIDNWFDAHPEATTTVQDGSITEPKLDAGLKNFVSDIRNAFQINNKFIKNIVFADYLTGLSGTYSPQGFCYDPYRDVFIFCFSKGTEESLLVKTDTNFEYISRVELPLYHCNDITCDEDNYYIAFGSNAANYNIGIVNASNMAIYESVTIPTLGSIAAIQYYEGAFYAFCETGLYKLDDLESDPVLLTQIERSSNYIGSMAGFNNSIIIPFWYAENDESVFEYAVVNLQSLAISRFYLNGADRTDELEGVTIYDGKILTYSYSGNYLNVYETRQNDLTERNYNSIKRIRYTTGSTVLEDVVDNIPANNLIVNYVQFSNSHPDLGGFNGVLISYMYNSPKYGFQVFISANGILKRNISNGSFSSFEKVLTSSDDATTSVRLSNSTITKGITFYRKRGIISVHSSGDLAASAAGTYDYGTLPEAYRPVVPVCIMPQNNVSPKCYIRIESSGAVKLYVWETTTSASNACMNMSYISAN